MTRETITGTKAFGERLADCDTNFFATLERIAGITRDDANKVFAVYRKQKLVKRDTCNKTWNVKHGGFLARAGLLMRDYYVTMIRGTRVAWLLGPFPTHAEALALVNRARSMASKIDPRSDFDAFGTSSLPRFESGRRGVLNKMLADEK